MQGYGRAIPVLGCKQVKATRWKVCCSYHTDFNCTSVRAKVCDRVGSNFDVSTFGHILALLSAGIYTPSTPPSH